MALQENPAENRTAEAEPATGAGILMIVWQRKLLIVCLALAGMGLGHLYYLRCPAVFQSTAQVLIVKERHRITGPGRGSQDIVRRFSSMHTLLLRSPTIAARAIEKQHLGDLRSLHGNPIGIIVGGLGVDCKTSGSTSVLTLNFKGGNAEDCPKILNAVVDAYKEFLGETYLNYSDENRQTYYQGEG